MCYSGHRKAADEDGDPETPGKGFGARNVESGIQVQLREAGAQYESEWRRVVCRL